MRRNLIGQTKSCRGNRSASWKGKNRKLGPIPQEKNKEIARIYRCEKRKIKERNEMQPKNTEKEIEKHSLKYTRNKRKIRGNVSS